MIPQIPHSKHEANGMKLTHHQRIDKSDGLTVFDKIIEFWRHLTDGVDASISFH